jgi:predicted transposase/invertase (TIGR01784 family)
MNTLVWAKPMHIHNWAGGGRQPSGEGRRWVKRLRFLRPRDIMSCREGMMPEEMEPPIREFADRGTIWLLDMPQNLRGLLKLVAADLVDKLDFSRAERRNRSFIPDDLQKQEADILYKVPFHQGRGFAWVYVLLEHQSRPDRTMGFRLLSYMVQVWEEQVNTAKAAKKPVRLYPILPLVFYTGKKKWTKLPTLQTLMELPKELEAFVPTWETLFLNLHETPADTLLQLGEAVALVLRALQEVDESKETLAKALWEAATRLDALPGDIQAEIKKGLHYLYLLIKHKRTEEEQADLFAILDEVIEQRAAQLQEVKMTGAQVLINQGKREGRSEGQSELLLELLAEKFGPPSEQMVEAVNVLSEKHLKALARRILTANSLEELGLPK